VIGPIDLAILAASGPGALAVTVGAYDNRILRLQTKVRALEGITNIYEAKINSIILKRTF
jgi:hypothetical protein